jgi:Zn-finger nucleic acid-binding protein
MTTIQLKQLANEGAAALDQVMALEATHPHENHPHDGLICPGCKIPLHQTKYAAAAGVWTSTCYNCGGLYIDEESLKNLDQQAHQGMATPAPLSPEVQAICSSLDQMTQVDQIRTQMLCNFLEYHGRYPNRRFW